MHNSQLLATLTIPTGQTNSNEVSQTQFTGCRSIMIAAPAVLPEATTLHSADADSSTATFGAVQSPPGTDITIAAGKRVVLTELPFPRFRLTAAAVAADRVFQVWARVGA